MKEIYLKYFKKKFYVKSSNKNMRLTYHMQLKMAQAQDIEDQEPADQIKATLDLTDTIVNYLKDVLKLNDKQVETLDDLETEETIKIANHVAMRLMGLSESAIKEATKVDKKEEKKD